MTRYTCFDREAPHDSFFFKISSIRQLNPSTTGNPFLGTKLLGFSKGRGLGALKGLNSKPSEKKRFVHFIFGAW